MVRGPERSKCSGLDTRSTVGGAEGGAELARVTRNHVGTVDSSDRGTEGLTTNKENINSIKRT